MLLGVFLPQGVERLKQQAPALVPWAWGVNGIFSVLAPVLAIAVSVTWGMDLLLLSALPIYVAGCGACVGRCPSRSAHELSASTEAHSASS